MARARTVSPLFFQSEELAECSIVARLLFVGLWTIADRAGRLEDRPKRIRAIVFPYDPSVDVEPLLAELVDHGFIRRYEADGAALIWVPKFLKHQHPHPKEAPSTLPPHPDEPRLNNGEPCKGQTQPVGLSVSSKPSKPSMSSGPSADPPAGAKSGAHSRAFGGAPKPKPAPPSWLREIRLTEAEQERFRPMLREAAYQAETLPCPVCLTEPVQVLAIVAGGSIARVHACNPCWDRQRAEGVA